MERAAARRPFCSYAKQAMSDWPLTSFTALQKSGRCRINSGQTSPSDLIGSAAFEPFVWTGRVLQAEDTDLEKLVLRFYIRSMRLLNAP